VRYRDAHLNDGVDSSVKAADFLAWNSDCSNTENRHRSATNPVIILWKIEAPKASRGEWGKVYPTAIY